MSALRTVKSLLSSCRTVLILNPGDKYHGVALAKLKPGSFAFSVLDAVTSKQDERDVAEIEKYVNEGDVDALLIGDSVVKNYNDIRKLPKVSDTTKKFIKKFEGTSLDEIPFAIQNGNSTSAQAEEMIKHLHIPHVEPALHSYTALNVGMAALDENNMFGPEFTVMGETIIP